MEIAEWLRLNAKESCQYIILDDEEDFLLSQREHLVKVEGSNGLNSSPRMKSNSQTTPLTTFALLLTICHAAQIHTFHLAVLMGALTNSQIGTVRRKLDWGDSKKKAE